MRVHVLSADVDKCARAGVLRSLERPPALPFWGDDDVAGQLCQSSRPSGTREAACGRTRPACAGATPGRRAPTSVGGCDARPFMLTPNQKKKRRKRLAKLGRARKAAAEAKDSQLGGDSASQEAADESTDTTAQHSFEPAPAALVPARLTSGYDVCDQDLSASAVIVSAVLQADPAFEDDAGDPEVRHQACHRPSLGRQLGAVYGNYHRYYGYRLGQGETEDPRLKVLDKRWLRGKAVLDVGCNEGVVTLGVAAKFGTASMLGIDIDETLIRKACRALRDARSRAQARLEAAKGLRSGGAETAAESASVQRKRAAAACAALQAVWFACGDFLEEGAVGIEDGTLGAVLCLSVTKWVHLNHGDDGVRALFAKMAAVLSPGGILVLEPQPWRSYQSAHKKKVCLHRSLDSLELRPDEFPEHLTSSLGLQLLRTLHVGDVPQGFQRPMYVFQKPWAMGHLRW